MKEARYNESASLENMGTINPYERKGGNTYVATSTTYSISPGVVNYPEQIKVMPYDELVKMQERLTALEKLILEGPTEPEARRESEVCDEVVELRERVAVLEVVVQELKYLIEAGR